MEDLPSETKKREGHTGLEVSTHKRRTKKSPFARQATDEYQKKANQILQNDMIPSEREKHAA